MCLWVPHSFLPLECVGDSLNGLTRFPSFERSPTHSKDANVWGPSEVLSNPVLRFPIWERPRPFPLSSIDLVLVQPGY